MEYWKNGIMERWNIGKMEERNRGNKGNRGVIGNKRKEGRLERLSEFGKENWYKSFEKQIFFC